MRRALLFALGTLTSVALLGFALRECLATVTGASEHEPEWPGWQVDATRWSLLGLALVLGLVGSVLTLRFARALEGEGVLLGVPLLLGGLLLSAAPSQGLDAAVDQAGSFTAGAQAWKVEQQQYVAESRLRPVPVPMRNYPPAPADLSVYIPTAAELGPGWFDGQRPTVVGSRSGRSASSMFSQATRIPAGWSFDRLLLIRVRDYASPDEARTKSYVAPATGQTVTAHRVGGVTFELRSYPTVSQSVTATVLRGARLWTVHLSSGQPNEPLRAGELDQVLRVMAPRIAR